MHRLTSQAFELLRIALISGAMALIDVVAGRVLHAHPNLTAVLALLAGYLAASVVPGAHWAAPWAPSIGAFNWLVGAGAVGGYVAGGVARSRRLGRGRSPSIPRPI